LLVPKERKGYGKIEDVLVEEGDEVVFLTEDSVGHAEGKAGKKGALLARGRRAKLGRGERETDS
jgi:hypothetical protein